MPSQSMLSPVKNWRSLNRAKMSFITTLQLVLKTSTWSGAVSSSLAVILQIGNGVRDVELITDASAFGRWEIVSFDRS